MEKAEKHAEVDDLAGYLSTTQITLCGEYRGLTVAKMTALRKELNKVGASGRVVKNTLARLSAERTWKEKSGAELEKFLNVMSGPNFVAYSKVDPVAPAKVLQKFAKDNDKFKIKGGFLEGRFIDAKGVEDLSKMPGKKETLAKLLALINAPAQQLLRMLSAPGEQVVRVIEAQRAKIEKGAAS
jgi:large subunit ribosomal protein L10